MESDMVLKLGRILEVEVRRWSLWVRVGPFAIYLHPTLSSIGRA